MINIFVIVQHQIRLNTVPSVSVMWDNMLQCFKHNNVPFPIHVCFIIKANTQSYIPTRAAASCAQQQQEDGEDRAVWQKEYKRPQVCDGKLCPQNNEGYKRRRYVPTAPRRDLRRAGIPSHLTRYPPDAECTQSALVLFPNIVLLNIENSASFEFADENCRLVTIMEKETEV